MGQFERRAIFHGNIFVRIVLNPLALALPFTILLIYLFPIDLEKHKVDLVEQGRVLQRVYFHDFDLDGDSEVVKFNYDDIWEKSGPCVQFLETPFTQIIIDQVNLDLDFVNNAQPVFADYNHDSIGEVYFFQKSDTALYIAGIEYQTSTNDLEVFTQKFVNTVHLKNHKEDFEVVSGEPFDLNGDGFDEIVFVINGHYSASPREICAYDLFNDTIIRTPQTALFFASDLQFCPHPKDSSQWIITTHTGTATNYKGGADLYDDSCGWAFALDKNLDFYFDPIPNSIGYGYDVRNIPFADADNAGIISIFDAPFGMDTLICLRKINLNGEILLEKKLKGERYGIRMHEDNPGELFWLIRQDPKVLLLMNTKLEVLKEIPLEYPIPAGRMDLNIHSFDLDNDKQAELVLTAYSNKIVIYSSDYSHPVLIPWEREGKRIMPQLVELANGEQPILYIKNGAEYRYYQYKRNGLYYWVYPICVLIYLCCVAFFQVLLYLQNRMLERRYELERQLYRHQILSVKNQVDPHFTLNAINNISALYMSGRNHEASVFLAKISRLVHQTLTDSDKIEITVGDELKFVTDYLDIQKTRFASLFDFEITVATESLNSAMIPRHLIYTFVENSLKHGLRPKGKDGQLKIEVFAKKGNLEILVDDNGVGRNEQLQSSNTDKTNGIVIIKKVIELIEKLKGIKIRYQIIDKVDEQGQPSGTLVKIKMSMTES